MREENEAGRLFVVSGPSAVGKGAVLSGVLERLPGIRKSVSVTTRSRAPNEAPGEEYYFVSEEEFSRRLEREEFLEWAEVHGKRYGTPEDWVNKQLAEGTDVVLEIDVQGGRQVHDRRRDACLIFLSPPSMEELERRIRRRGRDGEAAIRKRMEVARHEMGYASDYDYNVVNDDLEQAIQRVAGIIADERNRGATE